MQRGLAISIYLIVFGLAANLNYSFLRGQNYWEFSAEVDLLKISKATGRSVDLVARDLIESGKSIKAGYSKLHPPRIVVSEGRKFDEAALWLSAYSYYFSAERVFLKLEDKVIGAEFKEPFFGIRWIQSFWVFLAGLFFVALKGSAEKDLKEGELKE